MSHDISQPVPQGSNGAQDAENSRIAAIADELKRLCTIHEAQLRDSQADVSHFEAEQRAAEQLAKAGGYHHPATHCQCPSCHTGYDRHLHGSSRFREDYPRGAFL